MLKKLELKNFRSHPETALDFHPGINVIVGLSNSGKTNIIRALRWVSKNRPTGGKFLFREADKKEAVSVSLTALEGTTVSISRKGKTSAYTTPDDVLKGFGSKVPPEVKDLLRLSDLNFQTQFDPPFMVGASGGEIARTVNKITRLEKVVAWTQTLARKIKREDADISDFQENIRESKQIESELKEPVKRLDRLIKTADGLEDKIEDIETEKHFIKDKIIVLIRVEKDIDDLSGPIKKLKKEVKKLEEIGYNINNINENIDDVQNILYDFEAIEEINLLDDNYDEIEKLENYSERLKTIDSSIEEARKEIFWIKTFKDEVSRLDGLILELEDEEWVYQMDLKKALKEMKVCPFCASDLSEEKINKIVEAI